ncbi:hypothetical protein BKA70DRAFT_1286180 [Coprinopsis sp. MPI-PUGE-AT-0042]|nr:hypothetical protein BKA70DRAFT_1286180 [Coprinopsis sp. MPI-PUGE-AT-0042]
MVSELNNSDADTKIRPVDNSPPFSATGMEDHREYFWGVVRFQVKNTRFQLPLYRFVEESDFSATQYGLCNAGATTDGFATGLIELDVDMKHFECFLKAFLPRCAVLVAITHCHSLTKLFRFRAAYHSKPSLSKLEWISVLRLTTQWRFNDLRKTAIDTLDEFLELTAIERTLLAKQFDIPSWLLRGYEALIDEMQSLDRKDDEDSGGLTKEDVAKIGLDVVCELQNIVISRYRSMLRGVSSKSVEESIMGSSSLKEEYEEMQRRSEVERKRFADEEERKRVAEGEERGRLAEKEEKKRQLEAETKRQEQENEKRRAQERAKIAKEQTTQQSAKETEVEKQKKGTPPKPEVKLGGLRHDKGNSSTSSSVEAKERQKISSKPEASRGNVPVWSEVPQAVLHSAKPPRIDGAQERPVGKATAQSGNRTDRKRWGPSWEDLDWS